MCEWALGSRCFPGEWCDGDRACKPRPFQDHRGLVLWVLEQALNACMCCVLLWEFIAFLIDLGRESDLNGLGKRNYLGVFILWRALSGSPPADRMHQAYALLKLFSMAAVCAKFNDQREEIQLPSNPNAMCESCYLDHVLLAAMSVFECFSTYLTIMRKLAQGQRSQMLQFLLLAAAWVTASWSSYTLCDAHYLESNGIPSAPYRFFVPAFSGTAALSLLVVLVLRYRARRLKAMIGPLMFKQSPGDSSNFAQREPRRHFMTPCTTRFRRYPICAVCCVVLFYTIFTV